jgi:hypothetical protein
MGLEHILIYRQYKSLMWKTPPSEGKKTTGVGQQQYHYFSGGYRSWDLQWGWRSSTDYKWIYRGEILMWVGNDPAQVSRQRASASLVNLTAFFRIWITHSTEMLVHPLDGDTWKALDNFALEFAKDARNIHVGASEWWLHTFESNRHIVFMLTRVAISYSLPPSRMNLYFSPHHTGPGTSWNKA